MTPVRQVDLAGSAPTGLPTGSTADEVPRAAASVGHLDDFVVIGGGSAPLLRARDDFVVMGTLTALHFDKIVDSTPDMLVCRPDNDEIVDLGAEP